MKNPWDLTEREIEVMRHVCDGLLTKQIGPKLGLSPKTVEVHRSRINEKMACNGNAVLAAVRFDRFDRGGQAA